jgi:hypothetical protein
VDRGDGTILDRQTGLFWQKRSSQERFYYNNALAYVKDLNKSRAGGGTGWRLPNVKELQTLVRSKGSRQPGLPRPFDCSAEEVWTGERDFSEGYLSIVYVVDVSSGAAHRMLTEETPDDDSLIIPVHTPKHVLAVCEGR